jgi:hypothetical protein
MWGPPWSYQTCSNFEVACNWPGDHDCITTFTYCNYFSGAAKSLSLDRWSFIARLSAIMGNFSVRRRLSRSGPDKNDTVSEPQWNAFENISKPMIVTDCIVLWCSTISMMHCVYAQSEAWNYFSFQRGENEPRPATSNPTGVSCFLSNVLGSPAGKTQLPPGQSG